MSTSSSGSQALGAIRPAARSHAGTGEGTRAGDGTGAGTARRRLRSRGWLRLISPLVALGIWEAISELSVISAQKLPPPTAVWNEAISLITTNQPAYGTLQSAMLTSLERFAIGFAIGGGVALVLAIVAGLSRVGELAIDPLVQMIRTLPLFGLIPVFVVWFGIGDLPKLLLIALGASVPLYLNTYAGIRSVDARFHELGHVLELTRWERLRDVIVPGALPQVLVGLRQSLGVAWLSLVVAEQINANAGLGYMINQATQFFDNNVIFVALIVYTLLGLVTDWLVRILERRALTWRPEQPAR